jgi:hypothetical protein
MAPKSRPSAEKPLQVAHNAFASTPLTVYQTNVNFTDVWHRELEKEEEIGDFVNSL